MLRSVLATAVLAVAASFCASAQTAILKAKVPFDFQMGKAALPAGDYTIQHASGVLWLRNDDTGKAVVSIARSSDRRKSAQVGAGLLVFNRYGNDHFLSKVYGPTAGPGLEVPKGSAERELLARSRRFETATVTASNK